MLFEIVTTTGGWLKGRRGGRVKGEVEMNRKTTFLNSSVKKFSSRAVTEESSNQINM